MHDNIRLSGSSTALAVPRSTTVAELHVIAHRADDLSLEADAPATRRAYKSDFEDFTRWCSAARLDALPAAPQTVVLYLTDLAERAKVATLRRRIVAIARAHQERGFAPPTRDPHVRALMRGVVRTKGVAQAKKSALTTELLKDALLAIDDGSLRGRRDRALLLLGFAGAFRRSELVALDVRDLRFCREGLVVTLRRSKTDQEGHGRDVAIPKLTTEATCAVRAVKRWLTAGKVTGGPAFRRLDGDHVRDAAPSAQLVARLVKRLAARAGLDGDFAAHSLRAGFITSAAERNVADRDIQRVTGHKSTAVLHGYIRRTNLFDGAPLAGVMQSRS